MSVNDYTPERPPASPWPCPDGEPFRWVDGILECFPDVPSLAQSGSIQVDVTPFAWSALAALAAGAALVLIAVFRPKSSSSPSDAEPAASHLPRPDSSTVGALAAFPSAPQSGAPAVEVASCSAHRGEPVDECGPCATARRRRDEWVARESQ